MKINNCFCEQNFGKYKDKENYQAPDPNIDSTFWLKNIGTVLINQYKPYMTGKVADFGCNNGLWTAKVCQFENVKQIIGFDLNGEAIKSARTNIVNQIPETNHKISFIETNFLNIEFAENYFDFAYSFHTIEHIFPEDVDESIKQMKKVLNVGGHILINMPDKESYNWETTHVFHPNLNELDELMSTHGFEKIESYQDERADQIGGSRNITGLYKKL